MKLIKNLVLVLVCLALVVPAVLLVSGKLPYKIYVIHTGSMTPTIPRDSAVIVKEGVYHVGQVISFRTQHGVVTHRVVKRNPDGTLVTKGDANQTADYGSIQPSQVIGGVVAAPQMVGYWLWYLKNPAGVASLIMAIVCLWLIYSITMAYAKRAQRTGAAAPSRGAVEGVGSAALQQGGQAGEALQKVPVGWHVVEWPPHVTCGSAGIDAGAAVPEPIAVTQSASAPVRHRLSAVWHSVRWPLDAYAVASGSGASKPAGAPEPAADHGSARIDGAAAIPESIALTQSALEPAGNKPPVVWHFVEWPLDADALAVWSGRDIADRRNRLATRRWAGFRLGELSRSS